MPTQFLQNDFLLLILISFVSVFSLFYFYISTNNDEKYIKYWGLSWVMYACSLIVSIFLISQQSSIILVALKQVCDLLNSIFLLAGTYYFIGRKFPFYWIQFTIVNIIWIILAVYYGLSLITTTFLVSIFIQLIAIAAGVMLLKYWKMNFLGKFIVISIFFMWGVYKGNYLYLTTGLFDSSLGYVSEIILANLLNLSIMLIYLQKIKRELTDSERLYRVLANNAHDVIYVYQITPVERYEYISPSCKKVLGYDPEDFYDNAQMFTGIVNPDDNEYLEAMYDPAASFSEPITMRYKHKDGHYIWTEQKTTFIKEARGVTRIEGILRDITDRKMVEENLINAEKSRQTFLTNISHELRTPITSILGYILAMKKSNSCDDSKDKYLDVMYRKSIFLQRLIEDLFQLTNFEAGRTSFNFSQITVHEFVDDILNKYRIDAIHENVEFIMNIEDYKEFLDSYLIVDIERINQVCSNIIFNALKFMDKDKKNSLNINIDSWGENNDFVLVSIKDSGPGIPKEDCEKIFERFYRSKKNSKSVDGSGLGLTISKEIIEAHKGKIWVHSEIGKGSTFFFTIPTYIP